MTAATLRRSAYVPWLFVAGFALIVAVNAAMVWLAVSSFAGLHSVNPRQKGLRYNDVLAEQRVRDALGWTVALAWTPGASRLEAEVRDAAGRPLAGAQVAARLVRPLAKLAPLAVDLQAVDIGRFAGRVDLPAPGNWDVDLVVEAGGQRHASTRRMFLR